jgi:ketosteroid isomerase-like protein
MTSANNNPMAAIELLVRATNAHDLEGIVSCFADDYTLDAPVHPARSFRGKEQVRCNWTQILDAVPDISVRVLRSACDGGTAWSEWEMMGTRRDGVAHLTRGVFIFGVSEGLVRWGRMFLDPVDLTGPDMDSAVHDQLGSSGGAGRAGS